MYPHSIAISTYILRSRSTGNEGEIERLITDNEKSRRTYENPDQVTPCRHIRNLHFSATKRYDPSLLNLFPDELSDVQSHIGVPSNQLSGSRYIHPVRASQTRTGQRTYSKAPSLSLSLLSI